MDPTRHYNNNNNNKNSVTYNDLSNNIIVKESSGNSYVVNGINFIVGERKIKKMSTNKVPPPSHK
jgi:hypothetical protein